MSPSGLHAHAAKITKPGVPAGPRMSHATSSDAATVVAAPTVYAPLDVLFIAGQSRIFRYPHFFRRRVETLACVRRFFHFAGKIRHEGNLLFHVFPCAKPPTRSGMPRNHALPTKRQRALQGCLPLGRIGVVHEKP